MKVKEGLTFLFKFRQLFDRKEKLRFGGIMVAVFFMALFQALGVASVLPFISLVVDPGIISRNAQLNWVYNAFGFQAQRPFVVTFGILMLLIIIAGNLISAWAVALKARFAWDKNHHLSTALLNKYLNLPYAYFLNQNTADLNKNVLAEVQNLTKSFIIPLLEIIVDFVTMVLIFIAVVLISPLATLAVFMIFLLIYALIIKSGFRHKIKFRGNLRLKENRGRFKAASEAFGGIKDIKLLGREGYFSHKFSKHSLNFSSLQGWNEIIGRVPRYFVEIVVFGGVVAFILILIGGGRDIFQIIPLVSFFTFAGYRMLPLMNKIFQAFAKLQFNRAVLDKIHHDLIGDEAKKPERVKGVSVGKPFQFEKNIILKDLAFTYPNTKKYVFKDINIVIAKNTSVAIVGPTGCGKTTFVDIILGLLSPAEGKIEVDGIEINQNNLKSWQKTLGYVPQHIYLSDDTVKRNIAFGIPDELIEEEKVEKAAQIANLDKFIINELPKGYDTLVGERGIRLSGGQRQRVGIARSLYNDPDVLVLDEATSSLDGITEESVLMAIDNVSKLKTLIIVAHRLTTVKKCDMIYFLDKGKIIAQGNYGELLEKSEQFKAMARES